MVAGSIPAVRPMDQHVTQLEFDDDGVRHEYRIVWWDHNRPQQQRAETLDQARRLEEMLRETATIFGISVQRRPVNPWEEISA